MAPTETFQLRMTDDDGFTCLPGAEEWRRKETEEVRTGGKGEAIASFGVETDTSLH